MLRYLEIMSAPRRNHSKPHLSSLNSVEMLDLSPNPEIDIVPTLSAELIDAVIDDRSLIGYRDSATDAVVDQLSEPIDCVGEFAISSPAIDAGLVRPDSGTKLLPVLNGQRCVQVPKRIDALQEQLIQSMCSREDLQIALAACEQLHIQRFLSDLSNLKYADRGIAWLARKHGILPAELADLWRRHAMATAMMNINSGLPGIAADIVEDSHSIYVNCEYCDGYGDVVDIRAMKQAERELASRQAEMDRPQGDPSELIYRTCPQCQGARRIRVAGSADSRKMALEAAGLIGKRAAIITNPTIYAQTVESVIGELENLQLDNGSVSRSDSRLRINGADHSNR